MRRLATSLYYLLACSLLTPIGLADEGGDAATPATPGAETPGEIRSTDVELERMLTSAEPDEGPRPYVSITAGIFYYQVFGAGVGATVGVHALPRTVIEVDAYRASALVPNDRTASVAVRAQQFLSDHLYVRGGIRMRQLERKKILDFDEYESRFRQRDVGVDLAGGARWDVGSLVLGVDFAGIYMPFDAFASEDLTIDRSNGEILAATDRDLRMLVDMRLGYLYLGMRL
jgi:hypothetical protein